MGDSGGNASSLFSRSGGDETDILERLEELGCDHVDIHRYDNPPVIYTAAGHGWPGNKVRASYRHWIGTGRGETREAALLALLKLWEEAAK